MTVFEGDEELGLGLDEEAIEAWLAVGVPRERIVPCPRSENFWQAGPTGPCGPCSELYLDRGVQWGKPDDLPGGENERFLEYWNLVFMQYDQNPVGTLTPLPDAEHRHRPRPQPDGADPAGHRLDLRDRPVPAADPARRGALGPHATASDFDTDRALRILADHTRGMSFLVADGVVPSNEDRGYVLRRVMRRALLQGRRIGIEGAFLHPLRGRRARADGAVLPGAARGGGRDRHVARARGAAVRPDARAGHADPRRAHRAREGRGRRGDRRGAGVPAPRHVRLPVRADRRARGGAGARRRLRGLRGPDGGPAHAGAGERGARRRATPTASGSARSRTRAAPTDVHGLRADGAGDGGRGGRQRRTAGSC